MKKEEEDLDQCRAGDGSVGCEPSHALLKPARGPPDPKVVALGSHVRDAGRGLRVVQLGWSTCHAISGLSRHKWSGE